MKTVLYINLYNAIYEGQKYIFREINSISSKYILPSQSVSHIWMQITHLNLVAYLVTYNIFKLLPSMDSVLSSGLS